MDIKCALFTQKLNKHIFSAAFMYVAILYNYPYIQRNK